MRLRQSGKTLSSGICLSGTGGYDSRVDEPVIGLTPCRIIPTWHPRQIDMLLRKPRQLSKSLTDNLYLRSERIGGCTKLPSKLQQICVSSCASSLVVFVWQLSRILTKMETSPVSNVNTTLGINLAISYDPKTQSKSTHVHSSTHTDSFTTVYYSHHFLNTIREALVSLLECRSLGTFLAGILSSWAVSGRQIRSRQVCSGGGVRKDGGGDGDDGSDGVSESPGRQMDRH